MPAQTPADAQAPASATPAPGQPVAVAAPAAPAAPSPISVEQAEFLRARRTALSNQLESAQERRDEVADKLRDSETQASERPGLESRLRVLDERLVQLEKDIAQNAQQLANAPAVAGRNREGSTVPAGRDRPARGFNPNLVTILGFVLLLPIVVQWARRTFGPDAPRVDRQRLADQAAMNDRMMRLESAIEAVSIEVERIGEGQRFLTQAMADPIAARLQANGGAHADPMTIRARGQMDPV